MAQHNDTGEWGERIARETLAAQGYAIVDYNWHSGRYELDIIAMRGDRLVFVEVKTRADGDYDPYRAIDRRKIARLIAAAQTFMAERKYEHDMQFDVIVVIGSPENYSVEHIPDAFMPPLKTY